MLHVFGFKNDFQDSTSLSSDVYINGNATKKMSLRKQMKPNNVLKQKLLNLIHDIFIIFDLQIHPYFRFQTHSLS